MTDLAFEPALVLAGRVKSGEVGAEELLDLYLGRVERYNPALNAVIRIQADKAREKARAADAARARGEALGPLHGVPMTIKESYDWAGTPSTWGNPAFADNYPEADAVAV
ncbi:MAG TPA: amidase family protein, partial [Alphaproteobacteria bacterium]|nr:amidase family protein [Alphaproteobacteria bacterium]